MHQAAGIKLGLVREEDQPSAFNHRLVIIPLLAQISTLLDINHRRLVESRLG